MDAGQLWYISARFIDMSTYETCYIQRVLPGSKVGMYLLDFFHSFLSTTIRVVQDGVQQAVQVL